MGADETRETTGDTPEVPVPRIIIFEDVIEVYEEHFHYHFDDTSDPYNAYYNYGPQPWFRRRNYGFYDEPLIPRWIAGLFALVLIGAVATAIGIGLYKWANDGHAVAAPPVQTEPVGKTVPQILASEHFAVKMHALCSYVTTDNGAAYKLYLNRGGACAHTVQAVIPADMTSGFRGKSVHRASVTFVFNHKVYGPAGVRAIKQLSIGRQLMHNNDLRYIVARDRK